MVPVVMEELLHAAIKAAVQRDERLRAALPLGFMRGGGELIVNRAMAALREAADETFLRDVVDRFRARPALSSFGHKHRDSFHADHAPQPDHSF